ncbi:unnamed protein product [Brassicogethes aeneus]|uniref:Uncharacterized protein n=1 Tax=Brassicogethes aeneus TaxID=1431903 RepID=A0A9P0B0G4_BRAAE|nr:unnamed protein product [Brassicogethes aeneus]
MKSKSRSQTPFIKKYLKVSSIHGFKHLVLSKNRLEKLLWLNIIILATSGASYISYLTITRYIQNPTVTTIERNHFSWDTNFPAATICPTAKINEKMVHDLTEYSTVSNKSLFYEFMLALAAGTYDNFDEIPYFDELEKEQYITLLLEMQYEFKPVFRTSTGVELNYWENDQWDIVEEQDIFKVNFLDGESFIEVLNITSGFKIFFHGPYEVADIVSKGVTSSNGYSLKLSLNALSITSSNLTKSLNHNQRKCRFYYENNLKHFPIYSYVMCRMECRISLAKKLCGCVPHFYRRIGIEEVCGVIDLHCLAKYKGNFLLYGT